MQTQPRPSAPPGGGWAVLVLTTDYLASGYLKPVETPLAAWLNIPSQTSFPIYQAQTQVLNPQAFAVRGTVPELVVPRAAMIAFIPRDEPSMRSLAASLPPHPERAMLFYTGPYLIRATLRAPGDLQLWTVFGSVTGDMVPVTNAEVHYRQPARGQSASTVAPPIQTPVMAINKTQVQLYHVGA